MSELPKPRRIELIVDDDDHATIQTEIELRKARDPEGEMLPEGTSNLEGALLAEAIRDLNEYREIWEREHPPSVSGAPAVA